MKDVKLFLKTLGWFFVFKAQELGGFLWWLVKSTPSILFFPFMGILFIVVLITGVSLIGIPLYYLKPEWFYTPDGCTRFPSSYIDSFACSFKGYFDAGLGTVVALVVLVVGSVLGYHLIKNNWEKASERATRK